MICAGHFECAKVLIANGADTEKTCEGSYPLHIVSSLAALPTFKDTCMPAVQFLLEHGLSPYTECVTSTASPMLMERTQLVHLFGAYMTARRRYSAQIHACVRIASQGV